MSEITNKLYFGDNLDILREHIASIEGLMTGTERPRTPVDLGRGALMFKKAQVEKRDAEQGKMF